MNTHALVNLGRKQLSDELRVGIVLDRRVEGWKHSVLTALAKESPIRLELLLLNNTSVLEPPPLWQAYQAWDSREIDTFHLLQSSAILPSVPRINVELFDRNGQLLPQSQRIVGPRQLDVLLWLGEAPRGGDCNGLARFGVWRFSAGNPARPSWRPAYFREAYDHDPLTELVIVAHFENFDEAAVAYRHASATQEGWHLGRNAKELLDRAGVFLLRRLLDLIQFGPEYFFRRFCSTTISCRNEAATYPPNSVLFGYLGRQVARSLRLRVESRGHNARWFTAVRWNQELFTRNQKCFIGSDLNPIVPSAGCEEADPFILDRDGRHFLFFEEISHRTGRGRISFRELQPDSSSTPPVPVLQPPYHVSYPFLIQSNGELFMIPETSENRTIELHRCTEFPHQWRLEKVLCQGVALVDTTPFFFDGAWFFFTTTSETGELLLFYSDRLDGEWHYHRANPISSDVRNARSAGALFRRGDSLIRPAQDGSGGYGSAITLNEVIAISRSEYAERIIETISSTWSKGLLGTHTLNASDSAEVMDGLRYCE